MRMVRSVSSVSKARWEEYRKLGECTRECQALIPFSRGLLPAPSKLVGPALNTRNTISIGHGHRLSLSDPRFLPRRTEGRNDRSERTSDTSPIGKWSTMVGPHLLLHDLSRRRNISIIGYYSISVCGRRATNIKCIEEKQKDEEERFKVVFSSSSF